LQIGIVDVKIEDCTNCGYCGKRTEEEIYSDLKNLLNQVCQYLEQVCYARPYKLEKNEQGQVIKKTHTGDYSWTTKPIIQKLISQGTVDGVDEHYVSTSKYQKHLWEQTPTLQVNRWHTHPNKYGIWTEMIICEALKCEPIEWNLDAVDKVIKLDCC